MTRKGNMRYIDMETWPRRGHFEFFSTFYNPHLELCANVDLTAFRPLVKQQDRSINVAIVYLLSRAANSIPEFRFRIRGEDVVEHETVHPSTTIPTGEDLFSFCTFEYMEDFDTFAAKAAETIAAVQADPTLEYEPSRDDYLFMTTIPWVSFTNILHPLDLQPADSVPRIAWGKFFQEGERIKMPLDVQAHHALVDGVHLGRFYERVQEYLDRPETLLGES
jgi:chloramphenicol O-acetyltransferase type A